MASTTGDKLLKPILHPYEPTGTTQPNAVQHHAQRLRDERPDKCHLNRVVADTGSWEYKMAETLFVLDQTSFGAHGVHGKPATPPWTHNGCFTFETVRDVTM